MSHGARRFWGALLLSLTASGAAVGSAPGAASTPPPDLDAYVARVLKTFDVPGVGLAIVKDGAVVAARGYGVRRLGDPTPVDARTLFGIASNTKLFTATALGLLVEEGRLDWDAPVIRYLPWFAMWDPFVTRELTVRDLLVHRSGLGLGAGDLLWWPRSTYDAKEIVRRLRYVQPATSFRSAFAYDNVLYLVAGQVIEAVSGQTWEDFVTSRILKRVGMAASDAHLSAASRGGNIASPHMRFDDGVRPVAPFDGDTTDPAGGINSSAEDMAKWVLVQLGQGRLADGTQLFSPATWRQLTAMVTPIPAAETPDEIAPFRTSFYGYALGVYTREYRGHKLVYHSGGLPGFVSRVAMIPDANVGVVVLTNQGSRGAFDAIALHVLDYYLGAPPFDWVEGFHRLDARAAADTAEAERRSQGARDRSSKPSLPLTKYAGTFRDAWYGDIVIAEQNGKLTMTFTKSPSLVGDLEHWQHDAFYVRWRDRELQADAFVGFALKPDGSIDAAKMWPASPLVDFSYDFEDLLLTPVREGDRR